MKNLKFLFFGIIFGIILTKSEVISWFRIQEMFRFQAFHMYGIIGSAIVVAAISLLIMKRLNVRTSDGEEIIYPVKPYHKGVIFGGMIFGFGWALTGACPGPLYALIGNGYTVFIVTLFFAIVGAWVYGFFKERLIH